MAPGFVVDKGGPNAYYSPEWVEGEPRPAFWTGLNLRDRARYPVATLRCTGCGYLESYARPA